MSLALIIAALGSLASMASPAAAAVSHTFSTSIGASASAPPNPYPLSGPNQASVDQTTHDLYVSDPGNFRIEKFDPAGNFTLMFGRGVNQTTGGDVCTAASGDTCIPGSSSTAPGGFQTPSFIAVDNSGGPSEGDVYVADPGKELVQKFDASGHIISSWGAAGQIDGSGTAYAGGTGWAAFGGPRGIEVDSAGTLYVSVAGTSAVLEYNENGSFFDYGFTTYGGGRGLKIDSDGFAYASEDQVAKVALVHGGGTVLGLLTSEAPTTSFDLDPSNDELYQDTGTQIHHYAAGCNPTIGPCNPLDSFGSGLLSAAKGVAVDGGSGAVYVVRPGNNDVAVFGDVRPGVTTGPPSDETDTSVTVSGHIDPLGRGPITECRFEYGFDKTYGATVPCTPDPASNPPGSNFVVPIDVTAAVTGLSAGTVNHYRLVATNAAGGTTVGQDQVLITTAAPGINGLASANLTVTAADLQAQINPNGLPTSYHFEYGTTPSYGEMAPIPDGTLTASNSNQSVEVHLAGLRPHFVYHYRLVAENASGVTIAEDHTFNFYPPNCPNENVRQQTQANYLPDCRAYEIVSPGETGGTQLYGGGPNTGRASSPSRFAFTGTFGTIPGSGGSPIDGVGDLYVATRSSTGWVSKYVGLQADQAAVSGGPPQGPPGSWEGPGGTELQVGLSNGGTGPDTIQNNVLTDPGMSEFLVWNDGNQAVGSALDLDLHNRTPVASNAPYVYRADGSFVDRWPTNLATVPDGVHTHFGHNGKLTPDAPGGDHALDCPPVYPTGGFGHEVGNYCPGDVNASSDLSHFVFASQWHVFAPDGTLSGPGSVYDNDTGAGTVVVASKLANGERITSEPTDLAEDPLQIPVVSSDGSHILMASGAVGGCGYSNCPSPPCDGFFGASTRCPMQPSHLFMRVGGAVTYDVSRGYAVHYAGATADGSTVYFTSTDRITPTDLDSSTDLYVWSEATDTVQLASIGSGGQGNGDGCDATFVSKCGVLIYSDNSFCSLASGAGGNCRSDNFVASKSGDIYFFSPELLDGSRGIPNHENLYVYRSGQVQYVSSMVTGGYCVESKIEGLANDACSDTPITRIQVTPDGDHTAFVTASPVTQYDNAGHQEMYRYNAITRTLLCVSCIPDGDSPETDVEASQNGLYLTDDGRPFFSTEDALVHGDTNRALDVYEYVDGRPQLITPGTGETRKPQGSLSSLQSAPGLVGVSADGVDVFFSTYDTLVRQDHNGLFLKFYDARTGGGFSAPAPPPPCEAADECHATPSPTPPALQAGTGAKVVGGNAPVAKKKKKKSQGHPKKKRGKKTRRDVRRQARGVHRNGEGSR